MKSKIDLKMTIKGVVVKNRENEGGEFCNKITTFGDTTDPNSALEVEFNLAVEDDFTAAAYIEAIDVMFKNFATIRERCTQVVYHPHPDYKEGGNNGPENK